MENLHIANTDKFVEPYIQFVNKYFDSRQHTFLIFESKDYGEFINEYNNVYYICKKKDFVKMIMKLNKSDHIYLHGLFDSRIVALLYLQPWLLRKCSWIVWGGDLYRYKEKINSLKGTLYEHMRKIVIKNIGRLLPIVKGDYFLAKKWYKFKNSYKVVKYINLERNEYINILKRKEATNKNTINIQVGNSATRSNNHFEAFDMLSKFINKNIKIYCPLSYGDMNYAREVKIQGRKIFGDNFIPMEQFMGIKTFIDHLNNIDVGVFNNDRQQGLGNISALLFLGKKVYLKPETTMWDFYSNDNLRIFDINQINESNFKKFIEYSNEHKQNNYKIMKDRFTDTNRIAIWEEVFNVSES
ncbi:MULTISPECIES: TDP-N-acetylfucosamine:lipid II N-acetylfucosaminyltransferase [Allobacillus]|uniref:4-alpha-L-fucosyltransferase n=1 Tax=Allobacillus salarius TaxID=1955272 RepID=A0A556PML4_9BACI|nr:TDP-N-acetylfucosamine:lipid II N-acetylfucosaminyltransferase [Allobacillus salarius]TSJ65642.1 hypothetical protein FPQ13_06205 [Allobacillus salarius]